MGIEFPIKLFIFLCSDVISPLKWQIVYIRIADSPNKGAAKSERRAASWGGLPSPCFCGNLTAGREGGGEGCWAAGHRGDGLRCSGAPGCCGCAWVRAAAVCVLGSSCTSGPGLPDRVVHAPGLAVWAGQLWSSGARGVGGQPRFSGDVSLRPETGDTQGRLLGLPLLAASLAAEGV